MRKIVQTLAGLLALFSAVVSGLAFIYFHGSAWTLLDKDCGTRPFFRHLAGQAT